MNVNLHIDELVLHGFPPGDRYRIAAAVEAELARLIEGQGIPNGLASGGTVPVLDAGSFSAEPGARPQQIGVQIAQALFGGLSR
jgi:hypothetical protein